jgi:hypothetical protein
MPRSYAEARNKVFQERRFETDGSGVKTLSPLTFPKAIKAIERTTTYKASRSTLNTPMLAGKGQSGRENTFRPHHRHSASPWCAGRLQEIRWELADQHS